MNLSEFSLPPGKKISFQQRETRITGWLVDVKDRGNIQDGKTFRNPRDLSPRNLFGYNLSSRVKTGELK